MNIRFYEWLSGCGPIAGADHIAMGAPWKKNFVATNHRYTNKQWHHFRHFGTISRGVARNGLLHALSESVYPRSYNGPSVVTAYWRPQRGRDELPRPPGSGYTRGRRVSILLSLSSSHAHAYAHAYTHAHVYAHADVHATKPKYTHKPVSKHNTTHVLMSYSFLFSTFPCRTSRFACSHLASLLCSHPSVIRTHTHMHTQTYTHPLPNAHTQACEHTQPALHALMSYSFLFSTFPCRILNACSLSTSLPSSVPISFCRFFSLCCSHPLVLDGNFFLHRQSITRSKTCANSSP